MSQLLFPLALISLGSGTILLACGTITSGGRALTPLRRCLTSPTLKQQATLPSLTNFSDDPNPDPDQPGAPLPSVLREQIAKDIATTFEKTSDMKVVSYMYDIVSHPPLPSFIDAHTRWMRDSSPLASRYTTRPTWPRRFPATSTTRSGGPSPGSAPTRQSPCLGHDIHGSPRPCLTRTILRSSTRLRTSLAPSASTSTWSAARGALASAGAACSGS